jgi:hypothetical protein
MSDDTYQVTERGDPRDRIANQLPVRTGGRYRVRRMDGGRYQVMSPNGRVYITNVSYDTACGVADEMNLAEGLPDDPR